MLSKTIFATLIVAACWVAPSIGQTMVPAGGEEIIRGVTMPSSRKEMTFAYQGIIGKVSVKEGDHVKHGGTLMKQDDSVEQKRLEGLTLDADQSLMIKAKFATLENKQVELDRKTKLFNDKALSESEFLLAKLDVELADAEHELAKHQQKVKVAEQQTQEARVAQMTLYAPLECDVLKIIQSEGEMTDTQKPSIIVVTNNPLHIEVKTVPQATAENLKLGDELDVRYPGKSDWLKAKVIFIAPEADARAGTQTLKLELANPENRRSGSQIDVKFPAAPVATAEGK